MAFRTYFQAARHGAAGQVKPAHVAVFVSIFAGSSAAPGPWWEEISKAKVQPEQPAALFRRPAGLAAEPLANLAPALDFPAKGQMPS